MFFSLYFWCWIFEFLLLGVFMFQYFNKNVQTASGENFFSLKNFLPLLLSFATILSYASDVASILKGGVTDEELLDYLHRFRNSPDSSDLDLCQIASLFVITFLWLSANLHRFKTTFEVRS